MENMYMTVINEEEKLESINLFEVDFIESDKRRIVYYIGNKKYFHLSTKSEFDELLLQEGFVSLDRPNLVNLRKIRSFNEEYGKVFFEENPTSTSIFCTVARIKIPFVKNLLQRLVSFSNDKTLEIKSDIKGKIHHMIKGIFE
jgi:DNA-binding LytR/AlgR family response regulator